MALPWEEFQNTTTTEEAPKPWESYAPSLEPQVVKPTMGLGEMLFDPETAQNLRGAIQDVVYSIPGMAAQLPKMAYEGLKFAALPQERTQIGERALTEAVAQGQQMAADLNAPLGSRESFRGMANVGLMAAPAIGEAVGELALTGRAKPPIQTKVGGDINAIEQSNAQIQGGETPLGIEARPESTVPRPSDSNYAVREAQGAETGRPIPQEVANVPPEQPRLTESVSAKPGSYREKAAQEKWDSMTEDERWNHLVDMNPLGVALDRKQSVQTIKKSWSELQGDKEVLANTLTYDYKPTSVSQVAASLQPLIPEKEVTTAEPASIEKLVSRVEQMPTSGWAGYDFTPEEKAAILAREASQSVPKAEAAATAQPLPKKEVALPKTEAAPEVPPPVETPKLEVLPAPQKPSKIGQSIETKAVEAKLTQGFGETAGYDPITIADQSRRATEFVKSSPNDARSVIRGETPLPEGLRGTSLITAIEEDLLRKPDAKLAYELANSPLTSATSAAAQEMRLMSERVPDSLAAKFQEIREARKAGSKLRGETPQKLFTEVKQEIIRTSAKRPTWEAFVREIAC